MGATSLPAGRDIVQPPRAAGCTRFTMGARQRTKVCGFSVMTAPAQSVISTLPPAQSSVSNKAVRGMDPTFNTPEEVG
jgi:hypothetical protein